MKASKFIFLTIVAFLSFACAEAGKAGEECSSDEDCAEGLECHLHDGEEDHGECEEHSDEHGDEDSDGEEDHSDE